jgi:hypothetical protein
MAFGGHGPAFREGFMRRRGFLESCFAGVAGAAGLTDLALGAEEENPLDSLVGQAVDLETSDDRYW